MSSAARIVKRAMCIWLPQWPLQRLLAVGEERKAQGVVLYQMQANGAARVVAYGAPSRHDPVSRAADARLGWPDIRPGMSLAEAAALASLDAQRPIRWQLHDPHTDRLALVALAEWCAEFSPSVALEEADEPACLLLDSSGLGPSWPDEDSFARHIVDQFAKRGLKIRLAIADTLAASWAVAHFGKHGRIRQPSIIPPRQTWSALAPLPLAALQLPEAICALLGSLGVQRVEQLAALARPMLLSRFGPELLMRLDRATGAAPEAIVTRPARGELEFTWPLEHPTARFEMIDFALEQLVGRACQALARVGRGALRLECRFETESRGQESFVVGLFRPSAAERHVLELVRLKCESLQFPEPLASICLRVLADDRLEFQQQELFVDVSQQRDAPRELATLVDRLSNRLGSQSVVRPWLLPHAHPEFASQEKPLAALAVERKKLRSSRVSSSRPPASSLQPPDPLPPRPLHLAPRPRRLTVISVAPDGPPVQFELAGRPQRIVRAWGPERIETSWWRTRSVRRDYYQVETTTGSRYWLFRELATSNWFLHGEFA